MGEVVEVGNATTGIKRGDRIVVPFTIACGHCFFCQRELWSLCDNTNPNASMLEKLYGFAGAGLFGYSHLYGGYAGGQAEYVRVPFADVGALKIPEGVDDEQALFLSDIFPTGYMAAENCTIQSGDVVAVWGCGPVGQFAIKSAYMLGAERVIAIDRFPERLHMAESIGKAEVLNYEDLDVIEELQERTGGRGPDACIDAVGMEAHGTGVTALYDRAKQAVRLETDRPTALREAIQACRKGGTLSIPGVYGGFITDYGLPEEARIVASALQQTVRIPVVAVLGNHDFESGNADEVKKILVDVGVILLDGDAQEVAGIGFAGVKGFAGGFGPRALAPWGEASIKNFVHEAVNEALKLESALAR